MYLFGQQCTLDLQALCVILNSLVRQAHGKSPMRLVRVKVYRVESESRNGPVQVASSNVTKLSVWKASHRGINSLNKNGRVKNEGMISDGNKCVIYTVALYSDGFHQHKSLSDTRSVSGSGSHRVSLGFFSTARRAV